MYGQCLTTIYRSPMIYIQIISIWSGNFLAVIRNLKPILYMPTINWLNVTPFSTSHRRSCGHTRFSCIHRRHFRAHKTNMTFCSLMSSKIPIPSSLTSHSVSSQNIKIYSSSVITIKPSTGFGVRTHRTSNVFVRPSQRHTRCYSIKTTDPHLKL